MSTPEFAYAISQQIALGRQMQVSGDCSGANDFFTALIETSKNLQIDAYVERGIARRMMPLPNRDYTGAYSDFAKALEMARIKKDPGRELEALCGIIDLFRTGDRDPKFGIGKDRNLASNSADDAKHVLEQGAPDDIHKVNIFIQLGLLETEYRSYGEALGLYKKAEELVRILLRADSGNVDLRNRLMRVLTVLSVSYINLGRREEAVASMEEAYDGYATLKDIRGMGNNAMGLGNLHKKEGRLTAAKRWFHRAYVTASDASDLEISEMAAEALKSLE